VEVVKCYNGLVSSHPYRYFFRRLLLWLRGSFSFLWLALVAGYLMVLAGHAVYANYQSQQETVDLQRQLVRSQEQEARLNALLIYYRTDSFKEKVLRKDLLLKLPQEQVFALPESSGSASELDEGTVAEGLADTSSVSGKIENAGESIWRRWVDYLWTGQR